MENKKYWEKIYKNNWQQQRFFPNEELCRFLGRNYNKNNLIKKKVLELGSGTGNNIPAFLHFNFEVTAIDISKACIKKCQKKFYKNKKIKFITMSMLDIEKIKFKFDLIADVFSSYNLNNTEGNLLLNKIYNKLNKGGTFFTYFPSKNSTSWIREKKYRYDQSTLNGFKKKNSPFYGNFGFFRFLSVDEYKKKLLKIGFKINYLEKTSRTYNNLGEYFEFIIIEAKK